MNKVDLKTSIGEKLRRVKISTYGRNLINCYFDVGESCYAEYTITSDDCLLVREKEDIGHNHFVGNVESLYYNINGMVKALIGTEFELTEEENNWVKENCKC